MAKKILYVEDNPHNARLFVKLLYKYPHGVQTAASAKAGLEFLKNEQFDLIFLDINLPDMDGLTLIKHLKTNKNYQHIPTVALTANSMSGDKEICLEAGFDGYVAKPIMRVELYYVINHFLEQDDNSSSCNTRLI